MSVNSIARSEDLDWSKDLSGDRLSITSIESRDAIGRLENYPSEFEGQTILSGAISYEQKGRKGFTLSKTGRYEYRVKSGLFLLSIKGRNPTPEAVFEEINKQSDSKNGVRRFKDFSRQSLWKFFSNASQIQEISLLGHPDAESIIDLSNLQEMDDEKLKQIAKKYPIKQAKLAFEDPNTGEIIILKYRDGSFDLPQASREGVEYVIQLFERDVVASSR